MTYSLIDEIRAENARLEATKRRVGIVTPAVVSDALPAFLRNQCSVHHFADIAKAINAALSDPTQTTPHDAKARAAGDAP